MFSKRIVISILAAVFLLAALAGCINISEVNNGAEAFGTLIGHSECKAQENSVQGNTPNTEKQECIIYNYDGKSILTVKHQNACFNCCPGDITDKTTVNGNILEITEKESARLCHCLCLYDLDYQFQGIKPGTYTMRITGPYTIGKTLTATLQLSSSGSYSICIDRPEYPWN